MKLTLEVTIDERTNSLQKLMTVIMFAFITWSHRNKRPLAQSIEAGDCGQIVDENGEPVGAWGIAYTIKPALERTP